MKLILAMTAAALAFTASAADPRCYELRTYTAAPGKLDALHARFRDHTMKIFEKHGIVNVGYWVPVENPDNKLIYLLAHASHDAAKKSWTAFGADPEWKKAKAESESGGRLVAKLESVFLDATDYSPAIKPGAGKEPRVFELRTYIPSAGNLGALHARFRDHTVALFTKHGMTHIGYWTPKEAQRTSTNTLIYILAHQSEDAAKASFAAFRADPDWIKAKGESEKKAGGPLTEGGMAGVKSVFLRPTGYSPTR